MALPYFYDAQLRRIIVHFMRIFTGIRVKTGKDENGLEQFRTVPVVFGDGDRQAWHILNNASENTVQSTPRFSCWIQNIEINRDRAGYHGNFDTNLVSERKYNPETGTYEPDLGTQYQVDRLQPNPMDITMQVDVWTSNMEQKFQLFEQIYLLFNPALQIQKTKNPLDWTALDEVILEGITFDNQGVPKGTEDDISIMSFTFRVLAELAPPARVCRQNLIQAVIQEIGIGSEFEDMLEWTDEDVQYVITTPEDRAISVNGNMISLLGPNAALKDENGNLYSWPQLIDQYGELQENFSKLRLKWHGDITDDSQDIIGKIQLHPTLDNILIFNVDIDTLPGTTQDEIDGFIDPHNEAPGAGLPNAAAGQRYIITDEVGPGSDLWGSLNAQANDIIEYDGSIWNVDYDSSASTTNDVVLDASTGTRYEFDQEHGWQDIINKVYLAGYWRLQL